MGERKKKSPNAEEQLREIAIACLRGICKKEDAKDSDRIAAAKLLLEYAPGGEARELRVIMEDIPREYLT